MLNINAASKNPNQQEKQIPTDDKSPKKKKNRHRDKKKKSKSTPNNAAASENASTSTNAIKGASIEIIGRNNNLVLEPLHTTPALSTPHHKLSQEIIEEKSADTLDTSTVSKTEITNKEKITQAAITNTERADIVRKEIEAQRIAKKLAKKMKKQNNSINSTEGIIASNVDKHSIAQPTTPETTVSKLAKQEDNEVSVKSPVVPVTIEKSREQIKAEREAKKQAKQAAKIAKTKGEPIASAAQIVPEEHNNDKVSLNHIQSTCKENLISTPDEKKKASTKAERRALQEAQRAAKSILLEKSKPSSSTLKTPNSITKSAPVMTARTEKVIAQATKDVSTPAPKLYNFNVKLFNHLVRAQKDINIFVNNQQIHPIIARLGEQYAKRTVVGSNSRCIAFLNAIKIIIQDFETPPKKEFSRSLEAFLKNCVEHLQNCRPLAVSVSNAYKHIKQVLTQLPADKPESELKENLCHFIDTYLENQIGKAALAISYSMQEKIANGDVLLTFGCSSLIYYIFEEAHRRHIDFRVVIVDSRPFCEGQELLRRLSNKGIPCTYVLINAVSFVMPDVTKILLGAHALLSNGYVMARTGTAQVALVGRSFNVPVLVCCETHKFSERFQTDAIVYNELGDPDDLIMSEKCCLTKWQDRNKMTPLNLNYDITPPELVTAVVTEVSILPCTSVPVILRIKPTEIGYYN